MSLRVILNIQMYLYGVSWGFGFVHSFRDTQTFSIWLLTTPSPCCDPGSMETKEETKTVCQLISIQIINSIWEEFAHWKETGAEISILTYSYIWQWPQSFCHLFLKGWKVVFWGRGQHFPLFHLNCLSCSSAVATCLERKQWNLNYRAV